ncbi:MAG: hypothetical protein U0L17_04755 [Acutalibacteraceae bacterium]|nr:hypothetical protein [Acutalibacteraceae bacterium]
MKKTKIILSVLLVLLIFTSQFALSSSVTGETSSEVNGTTVDSNDDYVIKFSSSQSNKLLSCDEMSTLLGQPIANGGQYEVESTTEGAKVVYNEDGSFTLSKPVTLYGANLEVPITDEMREAYKNNTSHNLNVSFYLSKSLSEKKLFADTQIRVYTRFKTTGTIEIEKKEYTSYLKSTSLGSKYSKAYRPYINTQFNMLGFDDKPLENLDNVQSIIISLYHYDLTEASLEFSGIAFENTTPKLKEYTAPTPASAKTSVPIINYRRDYYKEWAGRPSMVKYSSAGGFDSSKYKSAEIGSLFFKNISAVETKQISMYYDFDIDEFNKGIVTANQEGGSKQAYLTLFVQKLQDTDGKDMYAEFELQFFMFNDEIITMSKTWVKPNDTKTIKFDVSQIDMNSVSYIKLSVQNYWKYCAADGRYYDYDQKTESNGKIYCTDNLGNKNVDVTNKVLTDRVMNNVEVFISSINTVPEGVELTTATTSKTTTTKANGNADDYEYAGYHFIDFKSEALDETYGNNPSNVDFLNSDYYQRYSLANHTYKNNNSAGTKVKGDKTYISDYESALSLSSGGYQVQLNSGFEKIQPQYQSSYWVSGKIEDANRTIKTQDHEPLKAQGEKYDYKTQMANAIKYANNNPDPKLKGYLAVDVYLVSSVHGYKNTQNKTYKAWCAKNNKKCVDDPSVAEVQVAIHAQDKNGEDCGVSTLSYVQVGQKTTLFIDVSELEADTITNVRIVAQNYANLANKEQGGDNEMCGITNVTARYSAIYVPGNKQSESITTTVNVTRAFSSKDAKKIKKLYDALPGLSVDDYNTEEDYNKLAAFIEAWSSASEATQKYCEEEYGIDYADIGMLEQDVYEKLFLSGDYDSTSPETSDTTFPIVVLLVALVAGILIIKTYRSKA